MSKNRLGKTKQLLCPPSIRSNNVATHEKALDELNDAMQEASQAQDGKSIAKISRSIHHCRSAIDRLFNELEALTTTLNEQSALFHERLDQLDRLGDF